MRSAPKISAPLLVSIGTRFALVRLFLALIAFVMMGIAAQAQVPQLINYQGRIAVGSANFNGSGQFKFALVDTTGATTYWSNDNTSTAGSQPTAAVTLPVAQGLYSVLLGDKMTAIPAGVFGNPDVRLRVWFNDGTHGFELLTPDQRIAAVGYAMMASSVPNGAITSAQIATGAVGTTQLANGAFLNGTAANVPLAGVTGMDSIVQAAAANPANTANGLATVGTNGLLNPNISPGLGLRVGDTSPLNIVCLGDSITVGSGASVQGPVVPATPLGLTSLQIPNATYWIASLRQMGFCQGGKTVWNLGQGTQKVVDAFAQYTNSPGVTVTATLMSGTGVATITSIGATGFIQSGEVVTSASQGMPANTTATMTTVATTCTLTDTGSGTSTLAVTGSTAGLANGMFVVSNNNNSAGGNGSVNIPANTTITVSGNTITTSAPISIYQNQSVPNHTVTATLYFISPNVTLSQLYTGDTGDEPLTFGGTLVTSTGTFTAGSTSVTNVTTTGTSVGLVNNMGIGSKATAPGSTFTISGSTLTLSQPATASGTFTFCASTPTYNVYTPQNTYWEQTNTSPHLLSPAVTGVPGVFLNFYGVNDAGNQTNLVLFENCYKALNAMARADGYTVIDVTQVPLLSTAAYNYAPGTAVQDTMTAWTRTLAYPASPSGWDYLFDVASIFPQGHPASDGYHISDGVHPNDLGHQLIAGYINDQLFDKLAPADTQLAYPFTNGGINENWLPADVALTDKVNTFSELDFGTTGSSPSASFKFLYNTGGTFMLNSVAGSEGIKLDDTSSSVSISAGSPVVVNIADGNGFFVNANHNNTGLVGASNCTNFRIGGFADAGVLIGTNGGIDDGVVIQPLTSGKNIYLGDYDNSYRVTVDAGGNVNLGKVGKTLSIKGGSNASSGTVTLTAGGGTITSTAITANSVIFLTQTAASGVSIYPQISVVAGKATITGALTDNSTYNWGMILVNQ